MFKLLTYCWLLLVILTTFQFLKNPTPAFQPIRKANRPCARDFSRALSKLQEIARNSDWFTALFAPVVIGRSYYSGIDFWTDIWKLI